MSDKQLNDYLYQQYIRNRISRRKFMGSMAAVGASATLISSLVAKRATAATPKKGGRLVIGINAAQAQDSLDPTKYYSTPNIQMGYSVHDSLVNRGPDLQPIPWLATHWEANSTAQQWVFDLRTDVEFHDGSKFGADDVIYSMSRHTIEGSESPAKAYMGQIQSIDKLSEHQVRFNLVAPNADFPMVLTDTRVHVTKAGMEDFTGQPAGTGPFKVVEFTPGTRYVFERNDNYWGDDGPYVDELEYIGIGDPTARINALIAGDINVLLQLDQKALRLIENSGATQLINAPSGAFLNLALMVDREPTNNNDVRLAIKHAVDREGIRDNVLKGLGSIGNDHPIAPIDPYYNAEIPQRVYDPDKANFHIKKAGLENAPIDFYGSDVPGSGGLAAAQHLQQSAKAAGIDLNVINPPADSYWSQVWIQKPICVSGWDARPVPDLILAIAFQSEASYNETKWNNESFDKLMVEARGTIDFAKRKEMYDEMQLMLHDNGGHVTLGFRNYVDAARTEVQGITPHGSGPIGFYQGQRTAWIDA
ncbi:MAG: ABC transporter substrate-binding protein [Rhodobacteraceae bacterium]|nr:ABC transporter substrate-binding protein [Paracoccaceae bacterium]